MMRALAPLRAPAHTAVSNEHPAHTAEFNARPRIHGRIDTHSRRA